MMNENNANGVNLRSRIPRASYARAQSHKKPHARDMNTDTPSCDRFYGWSMIH